MPKLTIVMYHYVRPIVGSRFPDIKGLELQLFEGQLEYILRHYNVVSFGQVIDAAHGGEPLPSRPALLTFDDGLKDHFEHVFPALRRHGIAGAFFPPSSVVLERRMLDINKVHFVLASVPDKTKLITILEELVEDAGTPYVLRPLEEYRREFWVKGRYDDEPVAYLKRMLQHSLPEPLRALITDHMFKRFVSADVTGFAAELYVSLADLEVMIDGGMEVGSHGHNHLWLDREPELVQAADIDKSLVMLDMLGLPRSGFLFCYPYGAYNDETLRLLADRECAAAVVVNKVQLAVPTANRLLELPRLNTNDLPTDRYMPPNRWITEADGEA